MVAWDPRILIKESAEVRFFCYQYNFMHSAYALLRIIIVHSDGNQSWTWLERIPCCMGYIA